MMPFESQAQRRYMYSQHPEIAKEFESATPKGAKLPERKGKKPTLHQKVKRGLKKAFK
jgi:hypothetical protein